LSFQALLRTESVALIGLFPAVLKSFQMITTNVILPGRVHPGDFLQFLPASSLHKPGVRQQPGRFLEERLQ